MVAQLYNFIKIIGLIYVMQIITSEMVKKHSFLFCISNAIYEQLFYILILSLLLNVESIDSQFYN